MTIVGDCLKGARDHIKPLANPKTTAEIRLWNLWKCIMWVKQRKSRGNGFVWRWNTACESVNAGDKDSVVWRRKQAKPLNTRAGTMMYTKVKLQ